MLNCTGALMACTHCDCWPPPSTPLSAGKEGEAAAAAAVAPPRIAARPWATPSLLRHCADRSRSKWLRRDAGPSPGAGPLPRPLPGRLLDMPCTSRPGTSSKCSWLHSCCLFLP
eukprot:scaffold40205_cov20-Tisochrysis_lutea.AAC.2